MNEKIKNYKVFFIVSNESQLNDSIKYYYEKKKVVINFKSILTIPYINNALEEFTTNIYYFEINEKDLNENDKVPKSEKYIVRIKLRYKKIFEGKILFEKNKNNFIYDFKFDKHKNLFGIETDPPNFIKYSKLAQFNFFKKALIEKNVNKDDELYKDLLKDSIGLMNYQKYDFDFYLELLNTYYTQIEIKTILEKFQIERVILPESFEKKDYSSVLETIEKDPSFIIKYCSEKDNKEKYKKIFYTILLYFRLNYEKEKDESL